MLRAQVDESDYWIYERGPIQEELMELRTSNVQHVKEINRLTRETQTAQENLRKAEDMLGKKVRKHPPHLIGHPPSASEGKIFNNPNLRQTSLNNMYFNSKNNGNQNAVNHPKNP